MGFVTRDSAASLRSAGRGHLQFQQTARHVRLPRRIATRIYAADALCKDLVNERKAPQQSAEGTATVSFLGAEGKELNVECAKVGKCPHNLQQSLI